MCEDSQVSQLPDEMRRNKIVYKAQALAVRNWRMILRQSEMLGVDIRGVLVATGEVIQWLKTCVKECKTVHNLKASEYYSKCKHSLVLAGNPVFF